APVPDVLDIARNPGELAFQSFNKPYGLARLIEHAELSLAADLFVMDPDLIFLRAFDLEGRTGVLRASKVNFPGEEAWRLHLDRALEICDVRRAQVTDWEDGHPLDVGAEWLAPAADWRELAPLWERLSLALMGDRLLRKHFGWTGDVTAGCMASW